MSDGDRSPLHELAAAYALGALDPAEKRAFEDALAQSESLRREVSEYEAVTALLALQTPPATLDPTQWNRIDERITSSDAGVVSLTEHRQRRRLHLTIAWGTAAAAAVAAFGLWFATRELSEEVSSQTQVLEGLSAQLQDQRDLLDQVLGENTSVFTLTATDLEPSVRVFWNRDTNRWVFHARNLPPAASGRTYQLWFIRNGTPVPSDTFDTQTDGQAIVSVAGPSDTEGITAAALSEEPAGGSTQPTNVLLVGAVAPI